MITLKQSSEILKRHRGKRTEWPIWAKVMKQFSEPEDNGIGDTVARMIGDEKSEAFKSWHHATFGKPCNCNGRQALWNRLYPLP